ncbi:crotonase/enoyl-CoA hydratase family protein [Rhodococcus sp. H29-C3]|uniref:crotonase/enoyl-CoA hydratase family protein n=1 Tax=Rhodococcus sp. H29-C3 TaxID=3046307 RepID=UPI0024B9F748|nr:crotonase/enoyl-CoA hydratase family protein [Rhodococcus sp. H29-C3]MDJ0359766.1 crotonase/enoyl-CoA hydratase family protein [Rhodococcus sp. H29-C3]
MTTDSIHDVILSGTDGHVTTWTLNLPDSRNPISGAAVIDRLVALVEAANEDYNTRVVILTGAGTAFSAGGNVKDMAAREGLFGGTPQQQREGYRRGIQRIPKAMYNCEVPIIAAVNGAAIGAGCDLAMMCDMRVASTRAFFAESFVKLGIIPGDGGAWLLPRAIGLARAAEMTFTGDRVDAQTALDWGMVSRVVEPADLLACAQELAARVAVNPPHTLRMTKTLLRESQRQGLDGLLELSAAMQPLAHHTEDHAEAISAFMEKRPGDFIGQ